MSRGRERIQVKDTTGSSSLHDERVNDVVDQVNADRCKERYSNHTEDCARNMAVKTMSTLLQASSRLRQSPSTIMPGRSIFREYGTSYCNIFDRTLLRRVNQSGWIRDTGTRTHFSSTGSPSLSFGMNSKSSNESDEERRLTDAVVDDNSAMNPENTQSTLDAPDDSKSVPTKEQEQRTTNIPGAQTGGGRKLAILYTCGVCGTRSMKQFTEQAYLHGVVLVRCPGCQSLHLIADRLGYFSDNDDGDNSGGGFDVAKVLKNKGGNVKTLISEHDDMEITLEDIVGREKMQELDESSKHEKSVDEESSKSS